ncbi:MAG TPA: hypothetical protein PKI20_21115 [Verrucomicrobiota bacterium]|nr:hypothetical protein [Verrucomicrobiota bacterium]HQL80255.1 hypothetical protein [Verrucomicrobiota bacterium]
MSRKQFIALNLVGGACGLLILCSMVLAVLNGRLNQSVAATQNQFSQGRQLQTTLQNLAARVAQGGQTDPALRDLLARHDLVVNLNTNRPARQSP